MTENRWGSVAGTVLRKLPAGQVLSTAERPAHLVQVREGALSVEFLGAHGRRCLAEVLGPGSSRLVGEPEPESARIWHPDFVLSALIPSVVAEVPMDALARQANSEPLLVEELLNAQQRQHEAVLARLALLRHPLRLPRVAASLLYLAEHLGVECSVAGGIMLAVTQGVIAATADLARPTTNAALQRLSQADLIHVERGMICILDRERLAAVAGGRADLPKGNGGRVVCRLRHPELVGSCGAVKPPPGEAPAS